jgi:hypothetical protein
MQDAVLSERWFVSDLQTIAIILGKSLLGTVADCTQLVSQKALQSRTRGRIMGSPLISCSRVGAGREDFFGLIVVELGERRGGAAMKVSDDIGSVLF